MIDSKEIIQNFEENFTKMTDEEREKCLKDVEFSFGAPNN